MYYITFLSIIYYVLTMVFPSSDLSLSSYRIYPQATMAFMCIVCMFMTIKHYSLIKENSFFKPYLILLILAAIYILYPFKDVSQLYDNVIYFMKTYTAIPFMFLVYLFLMSDESKAKKCLYVIYSFQVVYALYSLIYDRMVFMTGSGLNGELLTFDSNAGFTLIACVPFALMLPFERIKFYLYSVLVLACIYSGQRSAALAAVATFPICYPYIKDNINAKDIIILGIAFIILGIPFLQDAIQNIMNRNANDISNDNIGSGRNVFWAIVWNDFWDGNLMQIFFGRGTNTVPELLRVKYGMAIASHNGWLDHLYTFGLVGIVPYIYTIFNLFRYNKWFNQSAYQYRNIAMVLVILLFIKCTTSHGYWDITVMPLSLAIALLCAKSQDVYYEDKNITYIE